MGKLFNTFNKSDTEKQTIATPQIKIRPSQNIHRNAPGVKFEISKIHLIGLVTRLGWRYRQKISSEATKIRPGYVHVRSLSNGNWMKTLGMQCRIWTVHEYTAYIIEQTPYSTLQVYQRSYFQGGHIPPKMPDSLQKNVRQIWELTL